MVDRMNAIRARISAPGVAAALLLAVWAPAGAQQLDIETAGDVIMRVLPVGTLVSAIALDDYDGAEQFLLGFGLNAGVTEGLKLLVHKARPDGSDGESFPSGHTSIAFQSATFIHLRYGFDYGLPAYAVASFVGFSRVYARKHFIEDVLVGVGIGILSGVVFTDERVDYDDEPDIALVDFGVRAEFGSGFATKISAGLLGIRP